jgi:hypothetical protein
MAERLPRRVFISYSRRDREWLDRLVAHLAPLVHDKRIEPWVDSGKIDYGDRYNDEIVRAIDTSRAAVLLVSPNFQSSSFIVENELPRLLTHAEAGELKLYWLLVSDCLLADRLAGVYQCANDTQGALDSLSSAEVNAVLVRLSRDLQHEANAGEEREVELSEASAPVVPEKFTNSLAMPFAPVPGTQVLFSKWLTRVQDYALFAAECAVARGDWRKASLKQGRDHPVVRVTWQEAAAFCAWLSQREGVRYRLPCDAEWTLALSCDGEPEVSFPWGMEWPPPPGSGNYAGDEAKGMGVLRIGGYRDGHPFTAPVGSYAPNRLGIFDLGGNVWEWCADACGPSSSQRMVRGASWRNSNPQELLGSARVMRNPMHGYDDTGFRCILEMAG